MKKECMGCGGIFEDYGGNVHPFIYSSAGCWEAYSDLLAQEYDDTFLFEQAHRLSVDTYAVQHPGFPGRQQKQSVYCHLVSLYLVLKRGFDFDSAAMAIGELAAHTDEFEWLQPPDLTGLKTVQYPLSARSHGEHIEFVLKWAQEVYEAWHIRYGGIIRDIAEKFIIIK